MSRQIATIGVYGTTRKSFFDALRSFGATHFVDIRRRRGLRGSQYAYANATELQRALKELEIEYSHELGLAPTKAIREVQKSADVAAGELKSQRQGLSPGFVRKFQEECLESFDGQAFIQQFPEGARIVFFCVERKPEACHRSLVAEELAHLDGGQWRDITPA